jgi:hypothetical protein
LQAIIYLGVFSTAALLLLTSIIQTIRTNPGSIPEDKEWDMQTDSMAESSSEEGDSSSDIRQEKNIE